MTAMCLEHLPDAFEDDFKPFISFCQSPVSTLNRDVLQTGNEEGKSTIEVKIPHNSIMCLFNSSEMESLVNLFSLLYHLKTYEIGSTFHKYLTIEFRGKVYAATKAVLGIPALFLLTYKGNGDQLELIFLLIYQSK